jgi:RNA polymerase sigma factor for flagellar operon FliA
LAQLPYRLSKTAPNSDPATHGACHDRLSPAFATKRGFKYMSSKLSSTDAIVNQYIGYATSIAREWVAKVPATIDPADIHSAALDGLNAAARQFDPDHGASFASYARAFIIGRIKSLLRQLDTLTRGERSVANAITEATSTLQQMLSRFPSDAEVAEHIGVSVERVREINTAVDERVVGNIDDISDFTAISDFYVPEESALVAEQSQHIRIAVASLPDSMREVIELIYFDSLAVNEVAEKLGITHEAVSQRHMKGRELLRNALSEFVGVEDTPDEGRVSQRQRRAYLEDYRSATSNPVALLRSVEFAA